MELLEVKELSKNFGDKKVLKGISFTVSSGKIVGLLGKNGAGKSTIIKMINGLLVPSSGEVLINGEQPGVKSKSIISYLPERTYLDKTMTAAQAIKMFSEYYTDFSKDKAYKLLRQMDLNAEDKIIKMSKGMQEKLQLILVMSRKAKLYILDEPLGGIDPATRDRILDIMLENFAKGASVLISTHLIADVERILDEVIFVDDGQIVLHDEADKLREREGESIDEIFRRRFKNA